MSDRPYYHPQSDFFRKYGIDAPEATSHGIEDTPSNPLSKQIPKTEITGWHMDGNQLIAQTDIGEVVNHIPTNYICTGVDANNHPILKKIA